MIHVSLLSIQPSGGGEPHFENIDINVRIFMFLKSLSSGEMLAHILKYEHMFHGFYYT